MGEGVAEQPAKHGMDFNKNTKFTKFLLAVSVLFLMIALSFVMFKFGLMTGLDIGYDMAVDKYNQTGALGDYLRSELQRGGIGTDPASPSWSDINDAIPPELMK